MDTRTPYDAPAPHPPTPCCSLPLGCVVVRPLPLQANCAAPLDYYSSLLITLVAFKLVVASAVVLAYCSPRIQR